jgi:hypothetical protein
MHHRDNSGIVIGGGTGNVPTSPNHVMKTVPLETVLDTWDRHCGLGQEESRVMMKRFLDEQPFLGAYLLACDEQLGAESERSQLIPLVATIWDSLSLTRGRRLKQVQPRVIDRAEATNQRMLEQLEEVSEIEWKDSVTRLFLGYNQQPLLGFCIEILMADDEEAPELAPERIGLELIWLKTVIDCLDR